MRYLNPWISGSLTRRPKHSRNDSLSFARLTRWATCSYIAQLFSECECLSTLRYSGEAKYLPHSSQRYRGLVTPTNRLRIPPAVIFRSNTTLDRLLSYCPVRLTPWQDGQTWHWISIHSAILRRLRPLLFRSRARACLRRLLLRTKTR